MGIGIAQCDEHLMTSLADRGYSVSARTVPHAILRSKWFVQSFSRRPSLSEGTHLLTQQKASDCTLSPRQCRELHDSVNQRKVERRLVFTPIFRATLLYDPAMRFLLSLETQKSKFSVGSAFAVDSR